ncbi:pwi domain mrna processing protein [Lasallia pustulata]|uniref:Pwi domain mrna processing protein n=1 Tax=Lasallia pustulata TaxID=136370 RepID=A0A1W5D3R0_9LECA|nr:pwi domain mrna processing protein [Lasallia pustulata]
MATSVDARLLKQTRFPPEFSQKVDMKKVNVEVMKKWIAGKISEILGSEDDVVIELCFNLLEGARFPDIKVLQIQLTGFLDKDTAKFCKELWTLCLSAQSNPQGVPKELLEAKKLELIQEKIDAEKAAEEARKRKEQERIRDRNIDGEAVISTDVRLETRGLLQQDVVIHPTGAIIEVLHQGGR